MLRRAFALVENSSPSPKIGEGRVRYDHRRAFTLVELLVVVAIIGLLSTVAIVTTNSARINSRNTKRIADIKQLNAAFQLAYNTNGSFPDSSSGWVCISTTCTGGWSIYGANGTVDGIIIPAYLAQKPADPTGGSRYASGYIYNNSVTWSGTTGPSIMYALEGAVSCAPGKIFFQDTMTQCAFALDQRF